MKTITVKLTKFLFVTLFLAFSSLIGDKVQAQENEKGFILSMTEFTIKPGHDFQFKEGVKAWKACYIENGGDWTWNVWKRVQGKGNVYILTSTMSNWAEMDESDDSGKACRMIGRDLINPHVESTESNMARFMPKYSKSYPNTDPVLWVSSWQVKNWKKFMGIVEQVTGATAKVEGSPRGFWYGIMGGDKDTEDVFVATPFKNFAALDMDRDNVWTIFENEYGKKKRDELEAEARDVVEESWSYLYMLNEEMSHNSSSK